MDELVKVNYDEQTPTVMGRDLHKALKIDSNYTTWFKRMCEYGFEEKKDYIVCFPNLESNSRGGQNKEDHQLTIDMAKQICMIQRTEIGRKFREYFLEVEKRWNDPEAVLARALRFTKQQLSDTKLQLAEVTRKTDLLMEQNAIQAQQIAELKPKASYLDIILGGKEAIPITVIAKDYGWTAAQMNKWLHEKGVQFRMGDMWLLYHNHANKGYTTTRTVKVAWLPTDDKTKTYTLWTQKGRWFIYDLMKANGILPVIERREEEE